jgi:hypothetical protein
VKHYNSTIAFFIIFISFIIITLNVGNAKSQNYAGDPEQSDVYLKLSHLINDTSDDVVQAMSAIQSGDNTIALNILNNVTINLQELSNGLDVLVNEPITGGD